MNNLNVFILFSTLIYFKLEENKSGNLNIVVGLVSLYALYNLFRGSEGFINDPAPTDNSNSAGTRFCGTTNMWVAQTTASPPTCRAKDSVDADACDAVASLADATECNDVIKNTAKACTWTAPTGGSGDGTCAAPQGTQDQADIAACVAVTSLTDATECNAVIKAESRACTWTDPGADGSGSCGPSDGGDDTQGCVDQPDEDACNAVIKNSAKACTYTPAVIGFPAHCAKSDGRICGKYKDNGTDISAPSPGYAPLTDTKCNTIECRKDDHCDSDGKRYCTGKGECVRCSSPEHCDSDEICENNDCVKSIKSIKSIKCTSSSPYCNFLQELPDGCESDASKCSVKDLDECCNYNYALTAFVMLLMGLILGGGFKLSDKEALGHKGGWVVAAFLIDVIIAGSVFGWWHSIGSSIKSEWDSVFD